MTVIRRRDLNKLPFWKQTVLRPRNYISADVAAFLANLSKNSQNPKAGRTMPKSHYLAPNLAARFAREACHALAKQQICMWQGDAKGRSSRNKRAQPPIRKGLNLPEDLRALAVAPSETLCYIPPDFAASRYREA